MDIPDEGSYDYKRWQSNLAEIDAIENITDVINYVEGSCYELEDFFLCGEYDVISAGLNPKDVPLALVTELGTLVAEQSRDEEPSVKVYFYDTKYFVINAVETQIFDLESSALEFAGIVRKSFD